MKILFSFFAFFIISFNIIAQDTTKHDPLIDDFGNYPVFANSVEILSLTDSIRGTSDQVAALRILDFNENEEIVNGSPYVPGMGGTVGWENGRRYDCVSGDFDGDGSDELLTAWVSPNQSVNLELTKATRLKPTYQWQLNYLYLSGKGFADGPVKLIVADLDYTAKKEFVLAIPYDNQLEITAYSFDSENKTLNSIGSYTFYTGIPYDIAAGDFNGDGIDELAHVCHEINNLDESMSLRRFNYDPVNKTFSSAGGVGKITASSLWNNWKRLKITTGDFRNLGHDELVISLTLASGNSGVQVFNYIPILSNGSFDWPNPPGVAPAGYSLGNGWESNAIAADLNPDKKDGEELIVAGPGEVAVIKFNSSFVPYYYGNAKLPFLNPGALETYERDHFLAVEDVDADTSTNWVKEIIVAEHKQDSTTVYRVLTPTIDASNNITGLTQKNIYTSPIKSLKSEMIVGDFDGDAIRIGPPKLLTLYSIPQPIVELNVPPTHFDYLDGQVYDICKIFGDNPSEFRVTYTETQSQSSYFSSELKQGWGVSSELSGGFSVFGADVSASVQSSYDRGYYGSHSLNTTITASQVTSSTGDDWILATITDYDLWEYPLFAMGKTFAHILVQIPHFQGTQWFPSRNIITRNWLADHEVGNLFSYPRKNDIAAWTGSKLLTSFTGKYVSTASSGSWILDLSNQTIDNNQLTSNIGVEVGASVSGWGMEASVSGSYSREEITTHTSTATKDVLIEVKVADTDQTFGDTDYLITPFMYWGENGAMVIDYAVDPSSLGDPIYGTFWDKHYLEYSDPGFILPWRLDSLKGNFGTENLKLYNKSMHISPIAPNAGDTVHIMVNVHNFSLKNTPIPVTVRFYLGNPITGGTPIKALNGMEDFITPGPILAQNHKTVEMDWVVPSGLDNTASVYAVIDPENILSEIHEDNNVGFLPLKVQGTTGIDEKAEQKIPDSFILAQNYPNPFNPVTRLRYSIPQSSNVVITIFDVLGKEIKTLVNQDKSAGSYEVNFDASNLPSGVYFYQLKAGNFMQTKKMILIK